MHVLRSNAGDSLPPDHPWWWRNEQGQRVRGWDEGNFFKLDYRNREFRQHVADQAGTLVRTGVVDGVMLDWWDDDEDRLDLIRRMRAAVGDSAVILCNANDRQTLRTAPYINGYFMECYRSRTPEDWNRISQTLLWAEQSLRQPGINCVESWYLQSRQDLHLMRAITTLVLTHSDGYCLFSDPNDLATPDHLHDWYPFWNKSLGRPTGKGRQENGVWARDFDRGRAVYNPMGGQVVTQTFDEPRRSMRTGRTSKVHEIPPNDGDLLLKITLTPPSKPDEAAKDDQSTKSRP